MKNAKLFALLFLTAISAGCGKGNEKTNIITVDVNASHPKKELILQDFMDVEYIPLETNDEFVTQGGVLDIGDNYIIVKNWNNDGDIFVFDRKTGKGIRKINRKGQGAEEYVYINGVILDEPHNEMFVNSASNKKILVYDLEGNFKRSLNHAEGAEYLNVLNYDQDNLICYDMSAYYEEGKSRSKQFYHAIISKKDGSVIREIPIPFDIVKAPLVQKGDAMAVTSVSPIIPYQDNWLLVETSTDTVYTYLSKENKISPFLVKTSSGEPEMLLTMGTVTDRYCFIQTIKKVFDFTKGSGFPIFDLVYDRQENAVFDVTILNNDGPKKPNVNLTTYPVNGKIAAFQMLNAARLVEAYNNGELKGKLKELVAELNEESNPVIMLMKNR